MKRILHHPRVFNFFKKLPKKQVEEILKKIEKISLLTGFKNLDIKKLANTKNSFRLRIKNIRVIFEIDEKNKILYILDIDFRGNIY